MGGDDNAQKASVEAQRYGCEALVCALLGMGVDLWLGQGGGFV